MNSQQTLDFVTRCWTKEVMPSLLSYIEIPALSPDFDPDWERTTALNKAVVLLYHWTNLHLPNAVVSIKKMKKRTPLLLIEVPATPGAEHAGTTLMYGHFDKQPPLGDWDESRGLTPWKPVLITDPDGSERLYGRGGADDGYSTFAAVTAIRALEDQQVAHGRIVMLIEGSEESGSPDLPPYLEELRETIGTPSFIIALDSGCGDWQRLWLTNSLRGLVNGVLTVRILKTAVHSGSGTGIVPSTFDLICQLLTRLTPAGDGRISLSPLYGKKIRDQHVRSAIAQTAKILGEGLWREFDWVEGAKPFCQNNLHDMLIRKTWMPGLEVTGQDGIPGLDGGNVMRPFTALKLSCRLPPDVNPDVAANALKRELEHDPPHGAHVTFNVQQAASGWMAPRLAPWLGGTLAGCSKAYWDKDFAQMGEGGSIPFMKVLGDRYPEAQFAVIGVLGPGSNAHAPNEFLHLPYTHRLTATVAHMLAEHAQQK